MIRKSYLIKYRIVLKDKVVDDKEIKVKNVMDKLHAQVSLEDRLKKTYPDFLRLEIISCMPDFDSSGFSPFDFLGIDNPFGK